MLPVGCLLEVSVISSQEERRGGEGGTEKEREREREMEENRDRPKRRHDSMRLPLSASNPAEKSRRSRLRIVDLDDH